MERVRGSALTAGIAEMHGWREDMEDMHVAIHHEPRGSLFAVCDGHAGKACASFVAETLRNDSSRLLADVANAQDDVRVVLRDFFISTDNAFAEMRTAEDRSGTTCVLVLVETATSRVTVAHVGDSRAACGHLATGQLVDYGGSDGALTTDHSPGREDERSRIQQAGSWVSDVAGTYRVEGSLAVSRAFGDFEYKTVESSASAVIADPEVVQVLWSPQNFLLLCCDGVTEGNLTTADATRIASQELHRTADAAAAARAVCKAALAAGSMDNISCIVVAAAEIEKEHLPLEELEQTPPRLLGNETYQRAHEAFSRRASARAVLSSSPCFPGRTREDARLLIPSPAPPSHS